MNKNNFRALLRRLLPALLLLLGVPDALAADSVGFELGHGERDLTIARFAAVWDWDWKLAASAGHWQLGGYWELSAGGWRGGKADAYDIGITPVFRFGRGGGGPYFEAAIGARLLSDLHVTRDRIFSTRFQFGDHLGIGYRFGAGNRYDLGLRLQHLSNGGIRDPNPGINFLMLRYQYRAD